jgi:hypothetical protein
MFRDQTAIYFDNSPKTTIESVGAKHVPVLSFGGLKNRMTTMLTVCSTGHKFPAFCVFTGKPSTTPTPRKNTIAYELTHQEEMGYPLSMRYTIQDNGWFDESVTHQWFNQVLNNGLFMK